MSSQVERPRWNAANVFGALRSELPIFCEAVPRGYSVIFFSTSWLFGMVLLAATLAVPRFGLLGLAGISIAYVAARAFGFDRDRVANGVFLFNSLLTSLALAYLENYQPLPVLTLIVLLVVVSVGTLLVSVVMGDLFPRYLAVPPLSLPFVAVGLALFHLFHALYHIPLVERTPVYLLPAVENLPALWEGFFQAFGAIFFLPHTAIGMVVLACVLVWSRLAALHALVGYLAGVLFMRSLGMDTSPAALGPIGFNFVFCGMALGGIFLVPSLGSLVLAALGACLCVIVAEATRMGLCYLGIPPLALPLNVVILSALYALKCRARATRLIAPLVPAAPEANFRRAAVDRARFPDAARPRLLLPFFGARAVTQGFNGEQSHRGQWSDALDFEVIDELGNTFSRFPLDLEGNHIFATPVLAPCGGTVVKVVDDARDNAVGETNTDQNWGNLVIIRSDDGWFVKLCHLQRGSVEVAENARVAPGQVLARCGNSGRSPVPHLHMQAQWTELIGGYTMPFRLARYFTADGRYHASGVPSKDEVVSPAVFDPKMAACFEFEEKAWSCDCDGRAETMRSAFNVAGDRVLTTDAASLTTRVADQTFLALDYKGPAAGALFLVYLGLSRVPFVVGDDVRWSDRIDLRPALRPWAVVLLDLVGPLIGYPLAAAEHQLERAPDGAVRVRSTIRYPRLGALPRPNLPRHIEVRVSPKGIERVLTTTQE